MNVLLDTHAVLWWQAGGGRLSARARRSIEQAAVRYVSPLTAWEIATLARRGRIELDRDPAVWIRDLLAGDGMATAALTPEAAAWAGTLRDDFPGDPIDRLLYASAWDLRVPLVTKDDRLSAFARSAGDVDIIW